MHYAAPAKVTPPTLEGAIERSHLFARLDSARERPIVWLEAPPGAGKTILVASYLAARDLPCLWYRIDATDRDIGSFFHHLGIGASIACDSTQTGLPRLGPEHAGGGEAFARHYFRRLFECIPNRLLVFDDYQEAGADSPLHRLIAVGLSELPAGYRAMIISRSPPPKEYARLQSARLLELLAPQSFLLAPDETSALCHGFGEVHGLQLSSDTIAALHERCGGWVTGLVLMLEAWRTRGFRLEQADGAVPAVVFDYFASEILGGADDDTERVLLTTSMLEEITPELATALSGVDDASRRLDVLYKRGYFTVRHEGGATAWAYHQLFRQFLRRRAAEQLGDDSWTTLQVKAARHLAAVGNVEQAIALYRRLGDWQSIVPLLTTHAPILLAQGRHGSLVRWIDQMPDALLRRESWLMFWSATARMQFDPGTAKENFEAAFRRFRGEGDARGSFLALAMSVQCICYEQKDFGAFDGKLRDLEMLLEAFSFPDEMVEAVVYASLASCVPWYRLDHPSRDLWLERTLALHERIPDLTVRVLSISLAHSLSIYAGESTRHPELLEDLRTIAELPSISPLAHAVLKTAEVFEYGMRGDFESSAAARTEGLSTAENTGVVLMVPLIVSGGALNALALDDRKAARQYLAQMDATIDPRRRLDYAFLQFLRGWDASLDEDWGAANDWFERGHNALEQLHAPLFSACTDVMRGVTRHHLDDSHGGRALIDRVTERAAAHGHLALFGAYFAEAEIALDGGDRTSARQALSKALSIGRESGLAVFLGWRRKAMSRLCAEALAAGIEVPFTRSLIEKHGLLPPDTGEADLSSWPWPVVVRVLGGFELLLDGKPVQFSRKAPLKPLQLLELLVVLGGKQVPEAWLADALWPDAEGDAASDSLSTTILRLRRLLESKDLLIRRNRCLTLDRKRCWIDAWALEDEVRALSKRTAVDSIASAADRVGNLYGGAFMPQSMLPATLDYRTTLFGRTVDALEGAVRRLEELGESQRARSIAEKVRLIESEDPV
jgi:ATP/maltotriose-dependent transcriptional regulator MalT